MTYDEFLEQIKQIEIDEMREDQPDYMEFVIGKNHMDSLSSVFESYYGTAYVPLGKWPSTQAKKYAAPHGGIRKGQALYCLNKVDVFHCALLWPWSGGKATTVKLFQGENKEIETSKQRVWQRIIKKLFNCKNYNSA
jgi:hypothetical protein